MSTSSTGTGRRRARKSPRPPLSRRTILEAALELAERDGVEALSMRRLAASLGVEAMSLYHHVDGKDDVLDGLTGLFFAEIAIPEPTADWRHDVRALADAFRAATRHHPQTATLALTREAVSDAGIAATAAAMATMRRAGFGPEDAVLALRTVLSFLIGALLRELAAAPTPGGGDGDAEQREAVLLASGFPEIEDAAAPLARFDFDREYDVGLDLLVTALDASAGSLSGRAPRAR